ncbi:hypothetical protein SG0102_23790 [Intestinibaculum porci]|uniref:Uncharacterized protein n=1 Tax=Intestinibaculum porci TaxID=2487118 RepID=A0A3G9JGD6_9FIRM|nr:hypothetical protein SG0102_23790 [Intestinibaculum porci]
MLASLYDNPKLSYFDRMKADRIFIKLIKLGDLEAFKYHGDAWDIWRSQSASCKIAF